MYFEKARRQTACDDGAKEEAISAEADARNEERRVKPVLPSDLLQANLNRESPSGIT